MQKNTIHNSPFRLNLLLVALILPILGIACRTISGLSSNPTRTPTRLPTPIPSPLPPIPVEPGAGNPNEPVFIMGDIPFTSPFFSNTIYEPLVLLEDQAGFVQHNKEFVFRLEGQAIGPVEFHGEGVPLTYSLALPSIPQGTQVDVDNDGEDDPGVQVFAVAYWSNIWGGPFLEERDGRGWSTVYVSTLIDSERDDEVVGGILVVWSPDDEQGFPTGFGSDDLLFTSDDPTAPIPAGYNIVDLNQEPFRIYKQARSHITLNEGDMAVNDYSEMSYSEAFTALVEKVGREYPFTHEKGIDWQALNEKYSALIAGITEDLEFYKAIHQFVQEFPDGHVGLQVNAEAFFEENGGSFGLVLTELTDGRVLVTQVIPDTPGSKAGIQRGAEILEWDGKPVSQAIDEVIPYLGPSSTQHYRRLEQAIFLTRVPVDSTIDVRFRNPEDTADQEVVLKSEIEYNSLFTAIPQLSQDPLLPPVEGQILDDSGLGYIRVNTFSADYSLMARLWDHFINGLIDNQVRGLIIDLRANPGGASDLALSFTGYFFADEIPLFQNRYYSDLTQTFEASGPLITLKPGPVLYDGLVAVLISPYCVSACEGFAYALSQQDRSIIVGHFPTAGAFGEVGRGQYLLPGDVAVQFPTGRHETLDGNVLLEGAGLPLDISVPVTEESVLGVQDAVLDAAIEALLKQ